jgi:23S rRNA (uracil1939-C5)-methyltransferase
MREVEGVVGRLGGRGDGVVDSDRGRLYVPYTVAGDRVRVAVGKPRGDGFTADLLEVMVPGPDRVEPGCEHFHACGGCTMQQLAPAPYDDWKRDLVVQALARRDLSPPVAPLFHPPAGDRRRAEFVARRVPKGVLLGFH